MKLWPSDRFDIETTMSLEAVVAAVGSKTEPRKLFRFFAPHAVFQGDVSREGFRITRIIHYRNSFLPIVTGKFIPGAAGTRVAIRLSLHPLVTVLVSVLLSGFGLGMLATTFALLTKQAPVSPKLLIPFAAFFFGWAIVSGGFWWEAIAQKRILIAMCKET